MAEPDGSSAAGQNETDNGVEDVARTILPPIGSRGSRRPEFNPNPPEVDKFSRVMDKVMADRALQAEEIGEENAAGHIIARRENEMATKHGIPKVGKGVVEKFQAARHNTAIMSAMGHPGLEKLVAREEEEKRKRKARLKELTAQRSVNIRFGRGPHDSLAAAESAAAPPTPAADGELPNVYVALGQTVPGSRRTSSAAPGPPQSPLLPPAQQLQQQSQPQQQQPGAAAPAAGGQQLQRQASVQLPGPPTQSQQQQATAGQQQLQLQQLMAMSGGSQASGAATGRGGGRAPAGGSPLTRSAPGPLRSPKLSGGAETDQSGSRGRGQFTGSGLGAGRRGPQGGARWRRRSQVSHTKAAAGSGELVVRENSRVGRVLAEFGGHTDWCSVTVMRHSLATILQANIRGWLVRRKWHANPHALVEATKAALEAERQQAERRAALKAELERRAMTRKQKEKAANVLQMLFPQKSLVGAAVAAVHGGVPGRSGDSLTGMSSAAARAKWSRLNKNMDIAKELEEECDEMATLPEDSDSDVSDLGVEEMALIKMRARTPPWQKAEQSQWEGQWAKLNHRGGRGNLDVIWDLSDTAARMQAVQQRRAERGLLLASATTDSMAYDPATQPLPASVVSDLLVHRYIDKYTRLGLLDHLPLRAAAEAALQHQHQQQLLLQEQQHLQAQLAQQQQQQQHLLALQLHHQQLQQQAGGGGGSGSLSGGVGPGSGS